MLAYLGLCGYSYASYDQAARAAAVGVPGALTPVDVKSAVLPTVAACAIVLLSSALVLVSRIFKAWPIILISAFAVGGLYLLAAAEITGPTGLIVYPVAVPVVAIAVGYALFAAAWRAISRLRITRRLAKTASPSRIRANAVVARLRKLCELQDAGTARRIAPTLAWCIIAAGLAAGPVLLSRAGLYVGNKASTLNVALQVVNDPALCPPNTDGIKKPLCVVVAWSGTQVATRWLDADNGQLGTQVSITTQPRSLTGYQHVFPAIHPPVPIK